ncbi:MAG TPA: hypothetical protein VLL08_20190 [Kineosporiaceae bacterium]|nr:hypothetical protein [Kineosporiaceae bacterium]
MYIPGLGLVTPDGDDGWYRSEAVAIPVLGNSACRVLVNGYDDDPAKEDIHAAIAAFLCLDESVLRAAAPRIFEYYQDIASEFPDDVPAISSPNEVWQHIRPGNEVTVERDSFRDRHVYVSVECECAWEPEHGLQIVLRDGHTVIKVGPYDGHLTNAAAYARDDLEGIVYHRLG